MDQSPVSVCIAAYNAEETIRPLIRSLSDLEYPTYEVIIVDDGSWDATPDIVTEYADSHSWIRLIQQENRGASAARNRAFEEARYDIVAYTDSDTTVDPEWLTHLIAPFEDTAVGATTGRTVFETNETCTSWVRSVDIAVRNDRRNQTTRLANGPNCAFRRELLTDIGGFNPDWFHAEDTAVSYEVYDQGYEIRYVPEAMVFHVPEDDWQDYLRKRYRDAKAFTRVLLTHPDDAAVKDDFVPVSWKIQPPLFAALLVGIPAALVFGPLGIAGWMGLFGLGIVMNVPFATRVAWRARTPSFFVRTLGLTTARGVGWGCGLIIGGMTNIVKYAPKVIQG